MKTLLWEIRQEIAALEKEAARLLVRSQDELRSAQEAEQSFYSGFAVSLAYEARGAYDRSYALRTEASKLLRQAKRKRRILKVLQLLTGG